MAKPLQQGMAATENIAEASSRTVRVCVCVYCVLVFCFGIMYICIMYDVFCIMSAVFHR